MPAQHLQSFIAALSKEETPYLIQLYDICKGKIERKGDGVESSPCEIDDDQK